MQVLFLKLSSLNLRTFITVFFILSVGLGFAQSKILLDSVFRLQSLSNDIKLSTDQRIKFGNKAIEISRQLRVDSILLRSKKNLSYLYLITGQYDLFKTINLENLELATDIEDVKAMSNANFNLAWYYYNVDHNNVLSHEYYLSALKLYEVIGDRVQQAVTLTNIASIQDDEKDYVGSEENLVKSLRILNKITDQDVEEDKFYNLDLLGSVSYKLGNYQASINYHNQALRTAKKLKDATRLVNMTKNNLAVSYRETKNFEKAFSLYKDLLENENIHDYDLSFYALIIDNFAFTKFLAGDYDFESLEIEFKKALEISNEIDDPYTKLATAIDLAKFYVANTKKDSALVYANKSYELSQDLGMNEYLLESMLLLSQLTDGDESKTYLKNHIKLTDSLLQIERKVRNKFARIELETDKLAAENKQISKENLYLFILSLGLLLTGILVYIVIYQRAKNKELELVQVQQKANEDIYNLMLNQQDKVDEARALEKTRVSKELHDGILSRLHGTRFNLDHLNLSTGRNAIFERAKHIKELHNLENDIRKISHELNTDFVAGSGFMQIVSELIDKQTKIYGLTYNFDYTDDFSWELVPNITKINIYRIIQESMHNIYKHAQATHIKISFSSKKDLICLAISDDGKGFNSVKVKKGIGLKNMSSRVADVGGNITFSSQVNKGTLVAVEIPYKL
jgi:signal transduction histidine kinase